MNLGNGLSIHASLIQILMIIHEGEEHSHKGTKPGGYIRLMCDNLGAVYRCRVVSAHLLK